ncbi:MAG: bifunctional diaminohydroxyphosphoribosylaminopyrimidine deaminase/5-amino-6-(5-phosphoribosylamino)uracil reductase RibD [Fimbriimonas sp.]
MRRAILISRRGFPAPNPHVGCVLVRDGEKVGEGYHHHAGGLHAEANALRAAGDRARGATAYVTLEPCAHHGRRPPCADALIAAGVKRVVVACADPNPIAAGGLARVGSHGIETEIGLLEAEAAAANEQFLFAVRHQRPLVVLKAAVSLDGRIALPSGESQWITGPAARKQGHRLRVASGAVLVGRRTVEIDDPLLTARIPGVVNQPLRVVLDPHSRLSGAEKVFDASAPTLRVTGEIDLPMVLADLYRRGVKGLLVEGGAITAASFLRAGLVDRLELFLAPKLLGDGPSWLQGLGLGSLADAPQIEIHETKRLGPDLWIRARVANGPSTETL